MWTTSWPIRFKHPPSAVALTRLVASTSGLTVLLAVMATSTLRASQSESSLESLDGFVGNWISHIDEKYRDHPMIKRFNPELLSQELQVRWGVDREVLHIKIIDLDRPERGDRRAVVEGSALRNPRTGLIEMTEYNAEQGVLLDGTMQMVEGSGLVREYEAHFEGHPVRRFRERWVFTDASRDSFQWLTESWSDGDSDDGSWTASGVEVTWTRQEVPELYQTEHNEQLERLSFFAGSWEHADEQIIGGRPTTVRSLQVADWLAGNVWLRWRATLWGLPGIEEHYGWNQLTWDGIAGEYVQLWYDNQSALLFESRGNWVDERTLVLRGRHDWQGEPVERETIYRIVGPNEYHRDYTATYASGDRRQSVARHRRISQDVNERLSALEPFVGIWRGEFEPGGRTAPTMTFGWGDSRRSWFRFSGLRPLPSGAQQPEYDMKLVWQPAEQRYEFLTAYYGGDVVEDGWAEFVGDPSENVLRLHMRVHYGAGATLPFGEGQAGEDGHTLEFQRTLRIMGENELLDEFLIRREDRWEKPALGIEQVDGFRWHRLSALR